LIFTLKQEARDADVTAETSSYFNPELAHLEDGPHVCERRIDGIIYLIDRGEDVRPEIPESITLDGDVCCCLEDEGAKPAGRPEA